MDGMMGYLEVDGGWILHLTKIGSRLVNIGESD